MQLKFIKLAKKMRENLRQIEMDESMVFLNKENGFITYGVSSCIVFVGYCNDELLFMYHWSTPYSDAVERGATISINSVIEYIKCQLQTLKIDLNSITIYALGGQESSQNVVDALRKRALTSLPFKLNLRYLHLMHHEDYFDLLVLRGNRTFYAIAHHVYPAVQLQNLHDNNKHHPAPRLLTLAFYTSMLPTIDLPECAYVAPIASNKKLAS